MWEIQTLSPKKCTFPWGIWTPSHTQFLQPAESTSQTVSGLVQLFCRAQGHYRQSNRLTSAIVQYRLHYSICSNRPHLASAVMWPKTVKKQNPVTFLSFFSSFVSTRVGGGVSLGFCTAADVEAIKYLNKIPGNKKLMIWHREPRHQGIKRQRGSQI